MSETALDLVTRWDNAVRAAHLAFIQQWHRFPAAAGTDNARLEIKYLDGLVGDDRTFNMRRVHDLIVKDHASPGHWKPLLAHCDLLEMRNRADDAELAYSCRSNASKLMDLDDCVRRGKTCVRELWEVQTQLCADRENAIWQIRDKIVLDWIKDHQTW